MPRADLGRRAGRVRGAPGPGRGGHRRTGHRRGRRVPARARRARGAARPVRRPRRPADPRRGHHRVRTARPRWGADRYGVRPDLVTFAKAVTSGYQPLGGVLVVAAVLAPFADHPDVVLRTGHTYSGHPAASAAALANLDILEREDLLARARARRRPARRRAWPSWWTATGSSRSRGDGAVRAVGLGRRGGRADRPRPDARGRGHRPAHRPVDDRVLAAAGDHRRQVDRMVDGARRRRRRASRPPVAAPGRAVSRRPDGAPVPRAGSACGRTARPPARPPLVGDRRADVVVVGAGFTGLWTALALTERDPALDGGRASRPRQVAPRRLAAATAGSSSRR